MSEGELRAAADKYRRWWREQRTRAVQAEADLDRAEDRADLLCDDIERGMVKRRKLQADLDRAVKLLKELRAKATDPRAFPGADPYTRTWTRQEWVAEAVDPFLATLPDPERERCPGEADHTPGTYCRRCVEWIPPDPERER